MEVSPNIIGNGRGPAGAASLQLLRSEEVAIISNTGKTGAYYPGSVYGTGRGGDGAKWPGGLSASGQSPILNHYMLRQNARSAYHDVPQAKAMVDRFADTVVGPGLRLDATPAADLLGITKEQAEAWAEKVNAAFHCWAKSEKVSIDGRMNLYQAQRLAEICQHRDGEYFTRLYYTNRRDLLNPLQLSFLDPNQIRGYGFTNTYGFQWDGDGINRDKNGKAISYDVYQRGKDGEYIKTTVPAYGARSKRRMMLHGLMQEYPGQGRGFSRIGHALQEFENISDFSLSTIKKAINQSSITMYVKPNENNPASNPMIGNTGVSAAAPTIPSATETTDAEGCDPVAVTALPEATNMVPGSAAVFSLQEGEDLRPFDGSAPADSFAQFVDAFTAYLAASVSMPIELLLLRFNQNYSASRACLVLFWQVAEIMRAERATDFLNPIYENWLAGEIAAGRISAPGWSDPRLRAAWLECNWIGPSMPEIDPVKAAEAAKLRIEMCSTTLERTAREYNGTSAKDNMLQLEAEYGRYPKPPWAKEEAPKGGGAPRSEGKEEDYE